MHELELPKWVVAACAIAEFDPYFDIEIYDVGVMPTNRRVHGRMRCCGGRLRPLAGKAHLRLQAAQQGCPLVMDTNDRGMLDIERYDQPVEGFVHGRIDEATMRALPPAWTDGQR